MSRKTDYAIDYARTRLYARQKASAQRREEPLPDALERLEKWLKKRDRRGSNEVWIGQRVDYRRNVTLCVELFPAAGGRLTNEAEALADAIHAALDRVEAKQ